MISARQHSSGYEVQLVDHSLTADARVRQEPIDPLTFIAGELPKSYENCESLLMARVAYRSCDDLSTKAVYGCVISPADKITKLAAIVAQLSDGSVWLFTRDTAVRLMRDKKEFALNLIAGQTT